MRVFQQLFESRMPTRSFKKLWHVGTMNITDKGMDSYEGAGLSVSVHPDDWIGVARLGAGSKWCLTKPRNSFLDFHSLGEQQRTFLSDWAVGNGFATRVDKFKVGYWDEEAEEERYYVCDTEEEALEIANDDGGSVEPWPGVLHPAPSLISATRQRRGDMPPDLVLELSTTLYVEQQTNLDGVWWQDRYDPQILSIPRGVIVPKMVKTWRAEIENQ